MVLSSACVGIFVTEIHETVLLVGRVSFIWYLSLFIAAPGTHKQFSLLEICVVAGRLFVRRFFARSFWLVIVILAFEQKIIVRLILIEHS